ncbi:MAG: glycosyltransferase [Bacteroidales bacterium]|nr:glycosyltransferase [Bacteroidales bacterium]
MIFIAWFVFTFVVLQLVVTLINLIFRPILNVQPIPYEGLVSVMIPVRNEENTVQKILDDLIRQDYKNIEILVFDDESDDNTVAVINGFKERDSRIRLIRSSGLPGGWLGKMHACSALSQHAKGEFYLFLDADVRIGHDAILKAVSYARYYSLGLLSVFPKQIMITTGEWLTVPAMNYILLSLLPLVFVRTSAFSSLSAANGQFMLFNASLYHVFQPHEKMKRNPVEDIAISRMYKKNHIPVACLVGDDTIRCRMYESFHEAVHGFSKNVTAFFGNSFILAFLFWLITTAGFVILYLMLPLKIFFLYLLLYVLIRVVISVVSNQKILLNIILIVPHQLAIGLFIYKAVINAISKRYQWKGRYI